MTTIERYTKADLKLFVNVFYILMRSKDPKDRNTCNSYWVMSYIHWKRNTVNTALSLGKYKLEGKNYEFCDGDIINIKFNVTDEKKKEKK